MLIKSLLVTLVLNDEVAINVRQDPVGTRSQHQMPSTVIDDQDMYRRTVCTRFFSTSRLSVVRISRNIAQVDNNLPCLRGQFATVSGIVQLNIEDITICKVQI